MKDKNYPKMKKLEEDYENSEEEDIIDLILAD